jgi:hypothetical protein
VRGGYGLFFDQIFQNLTIFSMTRSGPEFYSQILGFTNSNVGVGQLPPIGSTLQWLSRLIRPNQVESKVEECSCTSGYE